MARPNSATIAAHRKALEVPEEHIPRAVAIIMDGNGRWARQKGLPRVAGHRQGAAVVRAVVTEAAGLGLGALTLYSFSVENWSRPREEVEALMHIYAEYLIRERPTLMDNNIRLRHLGRADGLPEYVREELDESLRVSAGNTGMVLCLALNYGSRAEIVGAVREIARRAADGELPPDQVDESVISGALDTAGVPDPDLLIRTSGEMRLSNFLLWQLSYAEFYVTDLYWPDFTPDEFRKALRDYAGRHRRFGGVDSSNV